MQKGLTVAAYCKQLGWGAPELARYAEISIDTSYKAFRNEVKQNRIKRSIANALTAGFGGKESLLVGDIVWEVANG